jgi:hypothetical protein
MSKPPKNPNENTTVELRFEHQAESAHKTLLPCGQEAFLLLKDKTTTVLE